MKMSGPVPMSPSTAPDSTVNQGSAASAPAGMVSGNEGAVNAGTTPVYNIADPLQGSGDPWASTTPWLSFSPGTTPAVLPSAPAGLPGSQSSGDTGTWQTGQSGNSAATFGMPPGFFRFWFYWPWRTSTGIPHCHSSRPGDGTDAAPTDVAHPRGDGSSL